MANICTATLVTDGVERPFTFEEGATLRNALEELNGIPYRDEMRYHGTQAGFMSAHSRVVPGDHISLSPPKRNA